MDPMENFYSPTGGAWDNVMENGWSALGMDLGATLYGKFVLDPNRKYNVNKQRRAKVDSLTRRYNVSEAHRVRTDVNALKRNIKARYSDSLVNKRFKNAVAGIDSKFSSLKLSTRIIGWGYAAQAAAMITEQLTTPGLTQAAIRNNANTFGPPTYIDSNQAYTQRQRAMQAIYDSQSTMRNIISQEASYFHR